MSIRNPLRSDAAELRRSLLPGLLAAHSLNVRNGAARTDLFAMGRTFSEREAETVGGLLYGERRARSPKPEGAAAFWDAKRVVEHLAGALSPQPLLEWKPISGRPDLHPAAAASIRAGGREIGVAGRIHPDAAEAADVSEDVVVFEIDAGRLLACAGGRLEVRPVPKFPSSARDVSFLVPDGVLAGDVIAAVEGLGEPLLESVSVFDEYTGKGVPEGVRALAFRIVYRSAEDTLTDEVVAALHERTIERVSAALGVQPRT